MGRRGVYMQLATDYDDDHDPADDDYDDHDPADDDYDDHDPADDDHDYAAAYLFECTSQSRR